MNRRVVVQLPARFQKQKLNICSGGLNHADSRRIQLQKSLDILVYARFEGMSDDAREALSNTITGIKDEYAEAAAKAASAKKGSEQEKYYTAVGEVIAKSVPNIVKGALSAAAAFKKGDTLAGTAALMDICAGVIPALASALSLAGPEGALLGSLFSAFAQILAFFAAPQPSLTQQIKVMLDAIEANQELADLRGVQSAINAYANQLKELRKDVTEIVGGRDPNGEKIEAIPLTNDNADQLQQSLSALKLGIIDATGQANAAGFETWKVGGWLRITANQRNDQWPEVLGVWCRTYSDLMIANTIINCMADPEKIAKLLHATDDANDASPISDTTKRHDVHRAVNEDLGAVMKFLRKKFVTWNIEALDVLNKTMRAAQTRGLYVHIGDNGFLYAGCRQSEWELVIDTQHTKNFVITARKEDAGSLTPKYDVFLFQPPYHGGDDRGHSFEKGGIRHAKIDSLANADRPVDLLSEHVSGFWALPAPTMEKDPQMSYLYVGDNGNSEKAGQVRLFRLTAGEKFKEKEPIWGPATKSHVVGVRAVTLPPSPLPDDPDKDGLPPGHPLLRGEDHYGSIHYAAVEKSSDIYVNPDNSVHYVTMGWDHYIGIEVDPYYLWAFLPGFIACATHASVIKCIKDGTGRPSWIEYAIPQSAPLKGLRSFCPCEDGTIVASDDNLNMWTTTYSVDLKGRSIKLTGWEQLGGKGYQIPNPCWRLFAQLKADLKLSNA